jgi:tetratricopeptide (TPR) repeat protein
MQQRAVQLTPEDHPDLPVRLNSLGISFQCRFQRTGDLSDLSEAVSLHQRAVHLTPNSHRDLPVQLNNLGNSFQSRFRRTGDLSDLAEAISVHQRAVNLTPEGHPDLPDRLSNLGVSFQYRFQRTGDLSDVSKAVSVHQTVVNLTPKGHPDLPGRLNNLGDSLQYRFQHTRDLSDLANAISVQQTAVDLSPEGYAALPVFLNNLGQNQYSLFQSNGRSEDQDVAISTFKLGATCISGPPLAKFRAARWWAHLLNQHHSDQPSEILLAFETALRQVTLIAGLEQTVQGRHSQLDNVSNIALEAASSACSLGRADKALEWLEQGRCLVWNQLNHLRSPLDELRIHHPELAARVRNVATQLEIAGSSRKPSDPQAEMTLTDKISLEAEASAHLGLSREWEELLQQVRAIHGFESFLQPLPCSGLLQHLPDSGAVVVINVDEKRCDAIALIAGLDEPIHIPLPSISVQTIQVYREALDRQLHLKGLRMRDGGEVPERGARPANKHKEECGARNVLRALWVHVVKPILDALAYSVSMYCFNYLHP